MGVQLLEAYSEAELDELGDFAPTDAVRDLVPKWQDFAVVAFVLEWQYPIPCLIDDLQLTSSTYGQSCLGDII